MDTLRLDLKLAWRWLLRSPGFTGSALATLALDIALTTATFSVVDGVLLRPLPFAEPERLLFLTRTGDVSVPDVVDWRAQNRTVEHVAAFARSWSFDLTGAGSPERLVGYAVEPEYFGALGVTPLHGRLFGAAENQVGGSHVALLMEGFWRSRFSADSRVIGTQITLSGNPVTIIGVLPQAFDFLRDGVQVVLPLAVELPWAVAERGTNNLDAIARLRPGVTLRQATEDLTAIERRLAEQFPRTNRGKIIPPLVMNDFLVGAVRPALLTLLAAVGLVLLVASVNLAGLLLARGAARQSELAVRSALGAGRIQVMRQLVVEGALLALGGGMAGIGLAWAGQRLIQVVVPAGLPRLGEVTLDWRAAAFGFLAAAVTAGVSAVLPAWQSTRGPLASALYGTGRGGTASPDRHRLLRSIVATEVALAVSLLIGSGLLLKSFVNLWSVPLGFDENDVSTASLALPPARYRDRDLQTRTFVSIVEQLRRAPGVIDAAYVGTAPLSGPSGIGNRLLFEARPDITEERRAGARARLVHGDYFRTLRIPIVAGRAFTSADLANSARVAIVNRRMAREFWPGQNPVGTRIAWRDWHEGTPNPIWMTVVGVAADVKGNTLNQDDDLAVYTPYVQRTESWQAFGDFVVRTDPRSGPIALRLQAAVWSVDPLLTIGAVETLGARRARVTAEPRFSAAVVSGFAVAALLLVVQGLYGIVAYRVAQRRREIGVRMALGATNLDVVRLTVRDGIRPAVIGLLVGLLGAILLGRAIQSQLFQVSAVDPFVIGLVAALVPLVALAASYLPARRAAATDPLAAIRDS